MAWTFFFFLLFICIIYIFFSLRFRRLFACSCSVLHTTKLEFKFTFYLLANRSLKCSPSKPNFLRFNLEVWCHRFLSQCEFNRIPCNSVHAIFIVDPLTAIQAGTIWRGKVHVHFWWIVHVFPYSIWIERLFEGQWFSSVRVFPLHFFFGGKEYLESSLHIFQVLLGWLGWMTLDPGGDESLWASPLLLFLNNSVMKKDNDLLL